MEANYKILKTMSLVELSINVMKEYLPLVSSKSELLLKVEPYKKNIEKFMEKVNIKDECDIFRFIYNFTSLVDVKGIKGGANDFLMEVYNNYINNKDEEEWLKEELKEFKEGVYDVISY